MTTTIPDCCCDPPPGPELIRQTAYYNVSRIDLSTGNILDKFYAWAPSSNAGPPRYDAVDVVKNVGVDGVTCWVRGFAFSSERRLIRLSSGGEIQWWSALPAISWGSSPNYWSHGFYPSLAAVSGGLTFWGDPYDVTSYTPYYLFNDDGSVNTSDTPSGFTGRVGGVFTDGSLIYTCEPYGEGAGTSSFKLREYTSAASLNRSKTVSPGTSGQGYLTGIEATNADLFLNYRPLGPTQKLQRLASDWTTTVDGNVATWSALSSGSDLFCANGLRYSRRSNSSGFSETWGANISTPSSYDTARIQRIAVTPSLVLFSGSYMTAGGVNCHIFATDWSGSIQWTREMPGFTQVASSSQMGITGMCVDGSDVWVSHQAFNALA